MSRQLKHLLWLAVRRLRLERVMMVLRACWAVRQPLRMLLAETFWPAGRVREFNLRKAGHPVFLRSRSSDLRVFHEIFCYRGYALPSEARRALDDQPVAIDAGANIGLFTLFLCQLMPGVRVTAFEPDPENLEIARRTLSAQIRAGEVKLVPAAVGTFAGEISFVPGFGMTSRRASGEDDNSLPVHQVDLFEHLSGAGLLKLDIEGAEWDILRDPRWSAQMPPCLVMEWHALHDNEQEPDPVQELSRLLSSANEVQQTMHNPGIVGQVWAFKDP